MALRVIQWSTSNVGGYTLREILGHPELDADCVVYTGTADRRPFEAVDGTARILASGKNAVSSSVAGRGLYARPNEPAPIHGKGNP